MTGNTFITEEELAGFENLLSLVPVEQLDIKPYAKRYLHHIILHKKYYCRIYARLLHLALQTHTVVALRNEELSKLKKSVSVIDYGAGNGVMGLLAKYCGFGKVYLNDLSPDFLYAATQLAAEMKIAVDGFIEGDIEQVKQYFAGTAPDIIVGTDVIEHIYDLTYFFKTVKEINPAMVTVMSTACNPANYCKVRQFKKLQVKDELYGGSPDDHALFGAAAIEPFIETRRRIIQACSKCELNTAQVTALAAATRGLRKDDIERAVYRFIADKIMPAVIQHPTNTCDPITGSWSERLLGLPEYKRIYLQEGFDLNYYDGFYNEFEKSFKSWMLSFVNRFIPFTNNRLSPFIILVGKRKC